MARELYFAAGEDRTRIALVDDDELFLRTFTANLAAQGYHVSAFSDPRQALSWLLAKPPLAAAIFDYRMPSMDGLALLRALEPAGLNVPVMLLSSALQPHIARQAAALGAVACIDKTVAPGAILQHLAQIIDARRYAAAISPPDLVVGSLLLEMIEKKAQWAGRYIAVSVSEFDILAHLAERAGTHVSYRDIYRSSRNDLAAPGEAADRFRMAVRASVERLRAKFLAVDHRFDALEHYAGTGYRWRPAANCPDRKELLRA